MLQKKLPPKLKDPKSLLSLIQLAILILKNIYGLRCKCEINIFFSAYKTFVMVRQITP